MYTNLLTEATLFDALLAIDQELAAMAQAGGCRCCAGRLAHSDYPRKPRGGPVTLSPAYEKRFERASITRNTSAQPVLAQQTALAAAPVAVQQSPLASATTPTVVCGFPIPTPVALPPGGSAPIVLYRRSVL